MKYLRKLVTVAVFIFIFIGVPYLLGDMTHAFWTWIPAFIVGSYLED